MPRKSKAALSVVPVVKIERRVPVPDHLTDDQAEVWLTIINHQEEDWFTPSNLPLLEAYCRHIDAGRKIALLIAQAEAAKAVDVEEYDQLLKMQESESRAMSSLATRMRLTQQAYYDASRKNKAPIKTENPLTFGQNL